MLANDRSQLDLELDALLTPLGVQREGMGDSFERSERQNRHITCLYSGKDAVLWQGLQPHLTCLEHQLPCSFWHYYEVDNETWLNNPPVAQRIQQDITRADIILLGLSVHMALCLYEHGRDIYASLVRRAREHPGAKILLLLLRAVSWEDDTLTPALMVPANRPIESRGRGRDAACVEVIQAIKRSMNIRNPPEAF